MQTKRSFNFWQWKVIICSMIGYSMFYFVRKNFAGFYAEVCCTSN